MRISRGPSDKLTVEELKSFLNVSVDRDEEIQAILNASIAKIEDVCGYSLTPQALRILGKGKEFKLYYGPVDEVSVKDEQGNDVAFTLNYSKTKVTIQEEKEVIIDYTTIPNEETIFDFKPYVYQYAALLYDGETDLNIINSVIRKVPIC